jgi:hypothetical protein
VDEQGLSRAGDAVRAGTVGGTGEQQEAEWQQLGASSVGKEAEVADAHEAARQQLEQEAAQELIGPAESAGAACWHGRSLASGR